MTPDSSPMDQAVSRAIRANLESLQRQSEEMHQAVADLISACASSRPANALSATLRAQSTAAALGASLEVLGRFIASAGQSSRRASEDYSPREMETVREIPVPVHETSAAPERPAPSAPIPMSAPTSEGTPISAAADISSDENISSSAPPPTTIDGSKYESAAVESVVEEEEVSEIEEPALPQQEFPVQESNVETHAETFSEATSSSAATTDAGAFDVASLPQDQQEMHRRANRVAKVSMQDIQLLKPKQVQEGREQHDICIRLKDEIGKARKEYERRFQPILGQGNDYFYHWMVEVLGKGDPETLGEYPYTSQPVQQ